MFAVTAWLAAEGTAEGETMQNPIIPHLPELVWSLVVFAIIYFVVKSKFVPAMERAYAERREAIEGGMEKADRAQAEAEAAKARYEAQLTDARTEAARIRHEAREQGAAIVAEMRGQAQAESARIVDAGEAQIEAQRAQAVRQVKGELGRLSSDLASKIVGESLHDEARQRGIIERFLADLESGAVQPERVGGASRADV